MKNIGIFAGSFDPVHKGHIAFSLEAIKQTSLDEVYFLPEIQPRGKEGITHVGHRVAMLNLALEPYEHLHVLELPDKQFTVTKTLPRLKQKFPAAKLFLLMGSDTAAGLPAWPNVGVLLNRLDVIVASRKGGERVKFPKLAVELGDSIQNISSTHIRDSLNEGKQPNGLLESTQKYIEDNWLYVSSGSSLLS